MQSEFVSGWAAAAREINALPLADIVDWLETTLDAKTSGARVPDSPASLERTQE